MSATELLLIDLSGLAHAIYHVSGNEPDPNYISTTLIARVRALASAHPHAAICCDAGRSFRHDLEPTYKANRNTDNRAVIAHQMTLACETLAKDGFPIWSVKGAEADDLIASAVKMALAIEDTSVLIASADKDLLQLVNERVRMKKTTDGNVMDADAVREKFKVRPDQMTDYLCLCGDASDNVKGAHNIGPKIAADLLERFGSLAAVFKAIFAGIPYEEGKALYSQYAKAGDPEWKRIKKAIEPRVPVTPAVFLSLVEFFPRHLNVRALIALKDDVEIPFAEVAVERTAAAMTEEPSMADVAEFVSFGNGNRASMVEDEPELTREQATAALSDATARVAERIKANENTSDTAGDYAKRTLSPSAVSQMLVPVDFSHQLEPRSMDEAVRLAQRMFESRLFSAYGTPQAVLATVLAGRELGMQAMASLRAFHIIEGKPTLSAGAIQALVMKSGKAKFFRCTERTNERATFETQRGDDPKVTLTYTMAEARTAFGFDMPMTDKERADLERKWQRSGWGKNHADMLVARASSKLARLVHPDVVSGLYAPEEME